MHINGQVWKECKEETIQKFHNFIKIQLNKTLPYIVLYILIQYLIWFVLPFNISITGWLSVLLLLYLLLFVPDEYINAEVSEDYC